MKKKLFGFISAVAMVPALALPAHDEPVDVAKHTIHPYSSSFTYYS